MKDFFSNKLFFPMITFIITGAPWYVSNLQLHEDLEVPYLAEHIRNLAKPFDSKILDSEILLVRQLGRYLAYPRDE